MGNLFLSNEVSLLAVKNQEQGKIQSEKILPEIVSLSNNYIVKTKTIGSIP